jgi:hypothetical protein
LASGAAPTHPDQFIPNNQDVVLQVLDIGSFFITPVNAASLTVQVTGYRSGALKSGADVTLALSTATPHQQVFLPQPSFTGVDTVSPLQTSRGNMKTKKLTPEIRSVTQMPLPADWGRYHKGASAGRLGLL